MQIGTTATQSTMVDESTTAKKLASGDMDVFSTPSMIALMEQAAAQAMTAFLEEGQSTVGTMVNIVHTAATPVGMKVTAHAEITGVEGKLVHFKVWAEDACGPIGEGSHTRAVVNRARFLDRAGEKQA